MPRRRDGFTIVELLIVIVVIAILASITIVAYNGITNRAKDTSVQSTLSSFAKKLEQYRFSATDGSEKYPPNLSAAGLSSPNDTAVNYKVIDASSYYCLDGSVDTSKYYISSLTQKPLPGQCPSTDNLVGWWPLNNSTKNMVTGDTNAVSSGITSTVGQNGAAGGAYSFTGNATDSFIDTQHKSTRAQFTMSIWVYPTADSGYRTPLSEVRDCCGTGYKGAEIKTSYGAGNPSIDIWTGGNGSQGTGGSTLPLNAWTLLTATYTGSKLYLYQNGSLSSQRDFSGDPGMPTATLKIGRMGESPAGGFAGRIDDVRVYTRALTAAEVQNLYQIGAQ